MVSLQKSRMLDSPKGDNEEEKRYGFDVESSEENRKAAQVVEVLTNILFEALQLVEIIPNMMKEELIAESEQLLSVANAFEGIKNNLIDFKNLIYWSKRDLNWKLL